MQNALNRTAMQSMTDLTAKVETQYESNQANKGVSSCADASCLADRVKDAAGRGSEAP